MTDTNKETLEDKLIMEDSAVIFEEFRDTAEVMEEEGLLPNGQKEKMEIRDAQFQGGTGIKRRGLDIRGEKGRVGGFGSSG